MELIFTVMGSETIVLDWEIEGIVFVYILIYAKLSQNRFFLSLIKKEQNIWNPAQRKSTEQIQEKYEQIRLKNETTNLALAAAMFTKK